MNIDFWGFGGCLGLGEFKKWGNQSKRQLWKEKSWIQGLAPKYSDQG